MWRYITFRKLGFAFIETIFLLCCGPIGYCIYFDAPPPGIVEYIIILSRALLIAAVFQFFLHLNDVYSFQGQPLSTRTVLSLLRAIFFSVLALCAVFFAFSGLTGEYGSFAWNLILAALFVFFWHMLQRFYLLIRRPQTNLLVLGISDLAISTVREILIHPELSIKLIGFVTDDSSANNDPDIHEMIIGNYEDFPNLVSQYGVNHIIVGLSDSRKKMPIETLLDLKTQGILVEDVTALYERITGKIPVENLRPSWLVFNSGFDISKDIFLQKRILSTLISLVLLILTSPILLLTMVMIKLDSKGPVFYKQERVGRNGRVYSLVKFRSMRQDAEKGTGPVWSTPGDDARVTRVGRFIRRTRIDELPQIYNVLLGEMDMVGPRPERPVFVEQLSKEIPYYPLRHVVKPGITGWAQVNYGYANKLEQTVEKLQYDLFYIKNISITLDMITLFETVKTVLVRKGS